MRYIYHILIILCCTSNFVFCQQISVDNSVGLQQLIEDNLVDGCVDISNISSSVNGIPHGLPSYGYFERAGSNFPFENGIVLSTGNAASAGNSVITPTLSEGSSIWGTDPDLEVALGHTKCQADSVYRELEVKLLQEYCYILWYVFFIIRRYKLFEI